jgi:hypothetical protein
MAAIPVPSSTPQNNASLVAPEDETKALRKQVKVLQTSGLGGYVTAAELASGTVPIGLSATDTLDFPNILAGAIASLTVTVTGAVVGDTVALGAPDSIEAGLMWSGYVSAANTVTIRLHNTTGIAVNPAPATWKASIIP